MMAPPRKIGIIDLGMVVCSCNSSTWEVEAKGSQIRGQPEQAFF
jgi:hypothetical protein